MSFSSNFPTIAPSLNLDFANTKALDPRITFTRASTATYYDGVTVAKAEENLFLQSQTFENASWIVTNSAITANTSAAPDGTTTAETITASAGTGQHLVRQDTSATGTLTGSVFAKAGTHNFLQIFHGNSANYFADFDLSGGTVGTTGASTTASIVSIGSGWYRCIITFTTAANSAIRFAIVSSSSAVYNESWTAVGTETILLWGAQLEQRSSVTAYTPTTTQPITNYIPAMRTAAAGVPRFDHNPVTCESLGLLIEEQRANLVLRSEDFTTAWSNEFTSEESNVIIAPDGTLTGDKLVENTSNGNHRIFQSITKAASAITYAYTLFVKGGVNRNVRLSFDSGSATNNVQAGFDLTNGTVSVAATSGGTFSAASASIKSVGNGWYRCTVIGTTGTETTVRCNVWILTGTTSTYTGDGFSGVYIWGAQLEAGAFATSYIPTVASSVTRVADVASVTGTNFSSWYRQDEGTFYAESNTLDSSAVRWILAASASSTTNADQIDLRINTGGTARSAIVYNAVQQAQMTSSTAFYASQAYAKQAMAFKFNDAAMSANASTVITDTSCNIPAVSFFYIGSQLNGSTSINGTIKKIAYYPLRLTNAQLQALTS